jgi:hypothetical protein
VRRLHRGQHFRVRLPVNGRDAILAPLLHLLCQRFSRSQHRGQRLGLSAQTRVQTVQRPQRRRLQLNRLRVVLALYKGIEEIRKESDR